MATIQGTGDTAREHRTIRARPVLRRAGLALATLILSALTACDNVQWGGIQVEFVPPPPAASEAPFIKASISENSPTATSVTV